MQIFIGVEVIARGSAGSIAGLIGIPCFAMFAMCLLVFAVALLSEFIVHGRFVTGTYFMIVE